MQEGDFIEIDYTGKIKDTDEIFDLTDEKLAKEKGIYNDKVKYTPVKIIIGEKFVVNGLEDIIKEMNVGEEKTEVVLPEKGFGNRDPKLVKTVSESELKKQKINPYPGLILDLGNMKARIQSVTSGRVRMDFNHPLAGRDLEYKIKINRKIDDKEEKAKTIIDFFGGGELETKLEAEKILIEEKKQVSEEIKKKIAELLKKYLKVEKVDFVRSF
ncbi:MAG: FKBP-type peptidyl-prolyl cis-trans isomerase [Candidatus Aenigmarchaeota archaeon]|nr:FKBP-type peptidyl-prolyl cis-trans isomerase [Candidatus Aenigmarchaeota archaeon]